MARLVAVKRPHAELAVAVKRRTAHDVARITDAAGIWLTSLGQLIHEVVEEPHAPVAPGQRENVWPEPTSLLFGHVDAKVIPHLGCELTFVERSRDLPAIRDYAIGVGALGQGL